MREIDELAIRVRRLEEHAGLLQSHGADMMTEGERRYRGDPVFHAAVDFLARVAQEHGFTPYELKQIACVAALRVELYSTKAFRATGKP